jgi:anti-sigma factor RsiW
MIRYIGCETARDLLDAFIDGELGMDAQVMVESHLRWCRTCAARVEDMSTIGDIVRLGPETIRAPHDDTRALSAMQAEVLTRVRAERDQSFAVRLREMVSDSHLLWPALGASMAVLFCLCGAFGVMQLATAENPDSLAAMIASSHPGSESNPMRLDDARLAPRVVGDAVALDRIQDDDAVFAVATVVTREGRVANYELLLPTQPVTRQHRRSARGDAEVAALLHAVKQSRFTPAQGASGRPVAVNMVWVFARTTVTRDAQLEELLNTGPQRRPVVDRVERAVPVPEAPKPPPVESPATRLELPRSSSTA